MGAITSFSPNGVTVLIFFWTSKQMCLPVKELNMCKNTLGIFVF